ncbi:MAG: flavodoxin domain-containing protein [Promethearchaeota archaeon]
MNVLIIYFSQTGGTEKITKMIQQGILNSGNKCEIKKIKNVDPKNLNNFDLIGSGRPTFFHKKPINVRTFIQNMKNIDKKHCFIFSTHSSLMGNTFYHIFEQLTKKGFVVICSFNSYSEYSFQINLKIMNTAKHPDNFELQEAKNFREKICNISLRIQNGESNLIPKFGLIENIWWAIFGYIVYVSAMDDSDQDDCERIAVYGIDYESDEEVELGGNIDLLDSDVDGDTIEELLDNPNDDTGDRIVVIIESLEIKLGKDFQAGGNVWILPVDGGDLGYKITNTGTWLKYTVVAIVRDLGEARDFDLDTPSDFSTPSREPCLFSNIENAHEFVDEVKDVDEDEYNLAVIGMDDINNVEKVVDILGDELDDEEWSVSELKEESVEEINRSIEVMPMFMIFAIISLILSIILILNIFNIIKEEHENETGILRAIGASENVK